MSFYEDRILPRMINMALGNKDCLRLREKVCADLSGAVLEVGFGSGLNLPYLPDSVDPCDKYREQLRRMRRNRPHGSPAGH